MKQKINPNYSISKGFTLVETLVAVSILLVAVVGPIGLIGDATHKMYYARDRMVAINLAQEGIEAVRKVRDSNLLGSTNPWDTGFTAGNYIIDVGNSAAPVISLGADQKVYYDAATGLYRQGAVYASTRFTRSVRVMNISATERFVDVTVSWSTGGDSGSIDISEELFKLTP